MAATVPGSATNRYELVQVSTVLNALQGKVDAIVINSGDMSQGTDFSGLSQKMNTPIIASTTSLGPPYQAYNPNGSQQHINDVAGLQAYLSEIRAEAHANAHAIGEQRHPVAESTEVAAAVGVTKPSASKSLRGSITPGNH